MTHQQRFMSKVTLRADGCWEWGGAHDSKGYGLFTLRSKNVRAHRFSYETFVGAIPRGLQIDHLCRNRGCCNPEHLEAVTSRINTLRGDTIPSQCATKTHCPRGHEYSGNNLYVAPGDGDRRCRECQRQRDHIRYQNSKTRSY